MKQNILLPLAALFSLCVTATEAPQKAPFKILYDNDLTNILGCPTPTKTKFQPFQEDELRASVAETASTGIDVHLLQPGLGWVPLWPSKVVPISDHLAFLRKVGRKPDSLETYAAQGGDVIQVFIEACRASKLKPFISMRMSDQHNIMRGNSEPDPAKRELAMSEFQFFADHPEWRMKNYAFDWAFKQVRDHRIALLREICENYDIGGLELDFMRAYSFFDTKKTPLEERLTIMSNFVSQVRKLLDRTTRNGKHRWLCVRIPGYPEAYDEAGIDLKAFCRAGVEMVNVSGHFFTDQQLEIAAIRRHLPPQVALYDEMQFVTAIGTTPVSDVPGGMVKAIYRRTTEAQYFTTAALAYEQGADGVSVFNFQYYRGTFSKSDVDGKSYEPPFGIFAHLADRNWLSSQAQNFFLGYQWDTPHRANRPFYTNGFEHDHAQCIPHPSVTGEAQALTLDLVAPIGGWRRDGRLRIQGRNSLRDSQWKALFDGTELKPTANVADFPPSPYDTAIGTPDCYRAWAVPQKLLKAGECHVDITLLRGDTVQLFYADISFP